ncbi:MAG: methyltransferase domain-containing protein [Acidimicrobiaceae bacterium]|nr:methyltransferase domain-containing protein [Acidimicrobiaceae bacterium]MBT5581923.1 methyltransferase domain-containing protein [Acidimicrobiaceae bacterium]MBT5852017.1 methyltransferase domain-containing protein [Acidimicrobiaceae bacterium]
MGDMKLESMGLYRNIDRVDADLAALGVGPDDPVRVDQLTPFDQFHYEGTAAVDDAAVALQLGSTSRVLDIGSGLGGPARYLADRTGCSVTALELQPELHEAGRLLTSRVGLADRVEHLEGDILNGPPAGPGFDGIVSMLCFLHIPDRTALFASCVAALRSGGRIFIDDYVELSPLAPASTTALAEIVHCPYLPDASTYAAHLTDAGFLDVDVVDKSGDWSAFVGARYDAFRDGREDLIRRYGEPTVADLDTFFGTVAELFAGAGLGGARITARRP